MKLKGAIIFCSALLPSFANPTRRELKPKKVKPAKKPKATGSSKSSSTQDAVSESISVSTSLRFDTLDLSEWDEGEVAWDVSFVSRRSILSSDGGGGGGGSSSEGKSSKSKESAKNKKHRNIQDVQSKLEDLVDASVAHDVILKVPKDLFPGSNGIKVTLPKTVSTICIAGTCHPVLCCISETFSPLSVNELTFAPSNIAGLFGKSKDCTITKPVHWDEWVAIHYGEDLDMLDPESLYCMDPDHDGVSNIVEYYGLNTMLLFHDRSSTDAQSGRRNLAEAFADDEGRPPSRGTNPFSPDTDGDLLRDDWELMWGFDPLVANDITQDTDDDGLSDFDEQKYHTNPRAVDTDGDGVSDFEEVSHGSDPLNDMDTKTTGTTVGMKLSVGDPSGSHSERYVMKVGNVVHASPEFGVMSTAVYQFRPGQYKITVEHHDSNFGVDGPDYDYQAEVDWDPMDGISITLDDPEYLLGRHVGNDVNNYHDRTNGKVAFLNIVETSSSDSCTVFQTCKDCHSGSGCVWEGNSCRETSLFQFDGKVEDCACVKCESWVKERASKEEWSWIEKSLPQCPCTAKKNSKEPVYWFESPPSGTRTWHNDGVCDDPNINERQYETHFGGSYGCISITEKDIFYSVESYGIIPELYKMKQHCCYDNQGNFISNIDEGAGTAQLVEVSSGPSFNIIRHKSDVDAKYFDLCCRECNKDAVCAKFLGPDNGNGHPGVRYDPRGCIDCSKTEELLEARKDHTLLFDDDHTLKLSYHAAVLAEATQMMTEYWAVTAIEGMCYGAFSGDLASPPDISDFWYWLDSWFQSTTELCGECGCCRARSDFASQFLTDQAGFRQAMEECALENCVWTDCYVFTGFAEGGAIAEIAAFLLTDLDPWLFTFGQPPAVEKPCPFLEALRTYRYINTIVEDNTRKHDPIPFATTSSDKYDFGYTIVIGEMKTSVAHISTPTYLDASAVTDISDDHTLSMNAADISSYRDHLQGLLDGENVRDPPYPLPTKWEIGTLCGDDEECKTGQCRRLFESYFPPDAQQFCQPDDNGLYKSKCMEDVFDEVLTLGLGEKIEALENVWDYMKGDLEGLLENDDKVGVSNLVCSAITTATDLSALPGISPLFDTAGCFNKLIPYFGLSVDFGPAAVTGALAYDDGETTCVVTACVSSGGFDMDAGLSVVVGVGIGHSNVDDVEFTHLHGEGMGFSAGISLVEGVGVAIVEGEDATTYEFSYSFLGGGAEVAMTMCWTFVA